MPDGGSLTVSTNRTAVSRKILIEISDTGRGIPQENLSKLFDPFFTTKEKGTGLGLALVYGIISKHQGTIQVKSALGQGTTFIIKLPVLDQKEWMQHETTPSKNDQFQGGKISERKEQDLIG